MKKLFLLFILIASSVFGGASTSIVTCTSVENLLVNGVITQYRVKIHLENGEVKADRERVFDVSNAPDIKAAIEKFADDERASFDAAVSNYNNEKAKTVQTVDAATLNLDPAKIAVPNAK